MVFGLHVFAAHQSGPWITDRTPEDPLVQDSLTSDKYFAYKMEDNILASKHVLRMSGYYNRLNQVGVILLDKIVIDRVL